MMLNNLMTQTSLMCVVAALSMSVACTPPVPPELMKAQTECPVQVNSVHSTAMTVGAELTGVIQGVGGQAGFEQVSRFDTRFDNIQRDYQLAGQSLCQQLTNKTIDLKEYNRRQACGAQLLNQMRVLEMTLEHVAALQDPRRLDWLLESKMLGIEDAIQCTPPQKETMGEVAVGSHTRGIKTEQVGNLSLTPDPKSAPPSTRIKLDAAIVCQRQTEPGTFAPLPECNGAQMREDDRFQITFSSNQRAWFYAFIYNGSGQFQTLFPNSTTAANVMEPGSSYTLPGQDRWWSLDEVAGVLEHIQLVAAVAPVPELEALRGADAPPNSDGTLPVVANKARGKIEPSVVRGVKTSGDKAVTDVMLKPDGQAVDTTNLFNEGPGVVGIEFEIDHIR